MQYVRLRFNQEQEQHIKAKIPCQFLGGPSTSRGVYIAKKR